MDSPFIQVFTLQKENVRITEPCFVPFLEEIQVLFVSHDIPQVLSSPAVTTADAAEWLDQRLK
jgi:hypothetical protein